MEFEITNCNNIDSATLELSENKINIKFAPNGTGKSTIAKAIEYNASDNDLLLELTPFKYKESNPENKSPMISSDSTINSVMCFNESYVQKITFKKDELINNSFDIFIKNQDYISLEQEIETMTYDVRNLFLNNNELETLISNLKEINKAFKLTKAGISKSSTGMKGLSKGNKIQHIPSDLEEFSPFIKSNKNVNWIDWQIKGYEFHDLSDTCPFCVSDILEKKEVIEKVGKEYDKNIVKNLVGIIEVIERLGDYFSEEARLNLSHITTLDSAPEDEHKSYLTTINSQINDFITKLERLRTLSSFSFQKGDNVSEKLSEYMLDFQFFPVLDSSKTHESTDSINDSINTLKDKAGELQGKINRQHVAVQRVIEKHQIEINDFLKNAGYKYSVNIVGNNDQAKLKLQHIEYNQNLSGGGQHLSFGERNAFAIVLFMYECLSKNPDLIILDDPISSYDKNKKYAILEMLFRRKSSACLKGKTVMMLTHDVEPIIDTLKSVKGQFQNQIEASYLKYSRGNIEELKIEKSDILNFSQICKNIINSEKNYIIKLVYLRRNLEIIDEGSDEYQVLSNLVHKRSEAESTDNRGLSGENNDTPIMCSSKFSSGCNAIKEHLPNFSYDQVLQKITDNEYMLSLYSECNNGYEKLQLFRILNPEISSPVIKKFINESYHIENEFICQLSPEKFDTIPEYVITQCDEIIESLTSIEAVVV